MKKYYSILAILAISLVACNKESNSQVSSIHEALVENGLKYIEIAVSQEKPVDPETKATLSDVSMAFGPGDQIAVLATKDATTAPVTLTYLRYEDSKVIFGGSVDEEATISPYAYYPASIATSTERVINWPTTIDGSKVQVPMIAYLNKEAGSARFQHLGAIAKIAVANCPVGASKLKFTANTNITGGYTVSDFKTGTPIVSASGELTGATITATIDGNGTYYIPLPVNSNSGSSYANFQFALINSAETYYYEQKTATESFGPFARRSIVNFGTLTYDVDQIEEWYLASLLTNWETGYKYNRFIKTAANTYYLNSFNPEDDQWWTLYDKDKNMWLTEGNTYWDGDISKVNGSFNRQGAINKTFWTRLDYNGGSGTWHYSSGNWTSNSDRAWSTGYVKLSISGLGTYNLSRARDDYAANYSWMYENLVIPTNAQYSFKFILNWNGADGNDAESGVSGSLDLTDSCPYGQFEWAGANAMTATLTSGKYNVYLDLADLNFMFVKQPYSD